MQRLLVVDLEGKLERLVYALRVNDFAVTENGSPKVMQTPSLQPKYQSNDSDCVTVLGSLARDPNQITRSPDLFIGSLGQVCFSTLV